MIILSCSVCQKKLSVKEELAGKKVKCPGCGQITAVPTKVAVSASVADQPTLPPAPIGESSSLASNKLAPSQGTAGERPTPPPLSKPDATLDVPVLGGEHDSSLTDFLAPPQAHDELGRLGDFRILKILGHGGMGVVFLGEDSTLNRKVAIKAMLPHLAKGATSRQRFLREARAAAALEHDHIVPIFHVGEDRGAPYIVMPFLKGQPLDERLKSGEQMPLADILRIGREIAEGLAAAHATDLIHRDIKPANIWLETPRDRVKILDFGLARAASQDSGLTQQGSVIGTPAYMAPEQGRGDNVDARCDLFSLGVVLYRLTTGQMPFHGNDTVSTLMSVAMHEPPPPVMVNRELPPELSDLVMKLLEKVVAQRIGSTAEVVAALGKMEDELKRHQAIEDKTRVEPFVSAKSKMAAANSQPGAVMVSVVTVPRRKKPALLMAVLVLGLFALVGAAGIILYWQTNSGLVQITINDPEIQVSFDQKDLVFKGVGEKQDLRVGPGEYGLRVKRGDLEFDTDKPLVIKRGDTITLKIELLKEGKLQVVDAGGKIVGAKWVKADGSPIAPPNLTGGRFALDLNSGPYGREFNAKYPLPLKEATVEAYLVVRKSKGRQATIGFGDVSAGGSHIRGIGFRDQRLLGFTAGSDKFPLERPFHCAAVTDGKESRLYVDGKLIAQAAGTVALPQKCISFIRNSLEGSIVNGGN